MAKPLFPLGRVVATPGALEFASEYTIDLMALLARHASGDWGNLDAEDQQANDMAVYAGSRIFSAYTFPKGKLWLITEADRSSTCFLLPDDY